MSAEIIVAAFGFAGVLVTALFGWSAAKKARDRLDQAEAEISQRARALDFARFMEEWEDTYQELLDLMEETNIDRFMIFRAWNGQHSPRWTTAVFQMRRGPQQMMSYVHFDLDNHYVEMLREVTMRRPVLLRTDALPESAIKSVYEAENVTSAYWEHIETAPGEVSRSVSVTYCSFATHAGDISPLALTRCKLIASRLRQSASLFRERFEQSESQ